MKTIKQLHKPLSSSVAHITSMIQQLLNSVFVTSEELCIMLFREVQATIPKGIVGCLKCTVNGHMFASAEGKQQK